MTPRFDILIEPAELAQLLGDPRLVVIDCTVHLTVRPVGPAQIDSGKPDWEKAHIPGAHYVHLVDELSDSAPGMAAGSGLPDFAQTEALLRRLGVNDDSMVVLYGSAYPPAATRAFWVLHATGVRNLRLLNGGVCAWRAAGLPLSDAPVPLPAPGDFKARPRPELRSDKDDMLASLSDSSVQILHALSTEQFLGSGGTHFGRPGRIPGSLSLPFRTTFDPETLRFHPPDALARLASEAGVRFDKKVRIYCGGGLAASCDFLILHMLGHPDLSLYDLSLTEWAGDPALPMITGPEEKPAA